MIIVKARPLGLMCVSLQACDIHFAPNAKWGLYEPLEGEDYWSTCNIGGLRQARVVASWVCISMR